MSSFVNNSIKSRGTLEREGIKPTNSSWIKNSEFGKSNSNNHRVRAEQRNSLKQPKRPPPQPPKLTKKQASTSSSQVDCSSIDFDYLPRNKWISLGIDNKINYHVISYIFVNLLMYSLFFS